MAKLPCPHEAQENSDSYMELRELCDKVEVAALLALSKTRKTKGVMMVLQPLMLGMETGEVESLLYDIAKVGPLGRIMHAAGSKVMRQNNFELPVQPAYDDDDLPEKVSVQIRVPKRR